MIVDNIGTEHAHQAVKRLRRGTLPEGIGLPVIAHTVHNVRAVQICRNHAIDRIDIILPVTVHADRNIAFLRRRLQSCQKRILMTAVAAERDARADGVLLRQTADQLPCPIGTAVIDKQHTAVLMDHACLYQLRQLADKQRRGYGQHRFLIIARNYNIQYRFHILYYLVYGWISLYFSRSCCFSSSVIALTFRYR